MKLEYQSRYHLVERDHWWFVGRRHLVCELVRRANADRACRIVDMGCAGGVTIQQLQADGYHNVLGVDISTEAIAQCQRNGLDNVRLMDAQKPDLPADSMDVIIASDVIEHLQDDSGAARAWFRLLAPGGVVVTFAPAFMFMWSPHDEANQHFRRYRLAQLRACLQSAGFHIERGSYWLFSLFVPAVPVRMLQRFAPPTGRAHLDLRIPPAPLNRVLTSLIRLENRLLLAGVTWPWGQSAMIIARKPTVAKEQPR